ncbi:type I-B CRISPR-associated protein Cas8b/Csh1 [Thermotoga sp. KOL6]|nr:type I-B CRISPR-associated protein Cas8b/Csh1 [Thermotoga sp. KOL6]
MLNKIISLGEVSEVSYSPFAEEVPDGKLIAIKLTKTPEGYKFDGLTLVEKNPGGRDSKVFLYKSQKGNFSFSKGPTAKFIDKTSPEKTFKMLLGFFNYPTLKDIHSALKSSESKILSELSKKMEQVDKKENVFLTVMVDGKLPAEIPEILRAFDEKEKAGKGKPTVCFICGNRTANLKLSDVVKFATFDKPGFTPYLSKKDPIRICPACKETLMKARRSIDEKLSFAFFDGRILWIIPGGVSANILKRIVEKISLEKEANESKLRSFARLERRIERALSEERATYDLVVIEKEQQAERIILHSEDVSPTRIREILEESERIENLMKEDGYEINVNFRTINSFFEDAKNLFNALFDAVFSERTFDKKLLIRFLLSKARRDILRDTRYKSAIEAFAIYVYLKRLKTLKGGNHVEPNGFFSKYAEFFDEPWKKAVFLEGVLTEYLLYLQQTKRNSKAFMKKLKGLKLKKQDVEGLLAEIRSKLEAYEGMSKKVEELLEETSRSFIEAGNWRASPEEISFVFVTGMSLGRIFFKGVDESESSEEQE